MTIDTYYTINISYVCTIFKPSRDDHVYIIIDGFIDYKILFLCQITVNTKVKPQYYYKVLVFVRESATTRYENKQ